MFSHPDYDSHEKVVMVDDAESGLKAIIAVHSTAMGPAAGGCRLWSYDSESQALADALRLSRGMSYKNAMADLTMGGGKAVILGPVTPENRVQVMQAFGRAVDGLGGQYITAEDVGVSVADMQVVATRTAHVGGLAARDGKPGGDPSPFTARGVRVGIEAAVKARLGRGDLDGLTVAVQGLGHVGTYLCEELHAQGARLVVADISAARVEEVRDRFQARVAGIDDILLQPVDVVAPCALGGTITETIAQRLNAPIVAGAANNQLLTLEAGRILARRGILYAPDYVINAGGIIMVAGEVGHDGGAADVVVQVDAIGERLDDIFRRAKTDQAVTNEVADSLAKAKLWSARQARLNRAA